MRRAIIVLICLGCLTACGKKPARLDNVPGAPYPHHYPAREAAPPYRPQ